MMTALPLYLGIDPQIRFKHIAATVIDSARQRDHHTCRCCGFRSIKYMQHRLIGDNWRDMDQVHSVCFYCQQSLYMELAVEHRSGKLIWLPEVDQASLNFAMPELYYQRIKPKYRDGADACLRKLTARSNQARRVLGLMMPTTTSSTSCGRFSVTVTGTGQTLMP